MKRFVISMILLLFILFPTVSEESSIDNIDKERIEILKFGIDSEITKLISTLKEEKDETLKTQVAEIFEETRSADILSNAVDYFLEIDFDGAVSRAEEILNNWEDENYNTLSAALRYVAAYPDDDTEENIFALLDHPNKLLVSAAITALGKCGSEKSADLLLDYLEDPDFPGELGSTIIKALGQIGSKISVDILIEILEDIDEEKSLRWTACEALGRIGDPAALPAIKQALYDKDTYLRTYAVKALAGFDTPETEEILIQSLKDSFWRVRVSAAEALGERKSGSAVDILIYKAEKDPEVNVKLASLTALGKIGDKKAFETLRELYEKLAVPQSVRIRSVEVLIEQDLADSIDTINSVFATEWEKDKSHILSNTCKFLSRVKHPKLKDLFAKMLEHNDIAIKIYGIRGVGLNRFSDYKERIEALTGDGVNNAVKREALSVLEQL